MIKKAVALSAAVGIAVMSGCSDPMGTRSTQELVRDMGMGINLGNTFDCTGDYYPWGTPDFIETAWGSPIITEAMIKGYAKGGFGVMRLPVSWTGLMDKETGYILPSMLERIDEVVGWIIDSGMYCIVNTHHDGWPEKFTEDKEHAMKLYEAMWTQIAEHFNKYGEELMFESLNEVGFDSIWNQYAGTEGKEEAYGIFNAINQKFVDVVRGSGGNNERRHLLIAAYWTAIDRACEDEFVFPTDPSERLAVSVHYYGPSTLTLLTSDASWGKARTDWGSEEDYKELNMYMDMMKENFVDKGIPVIVGEYGCFGNNKSREVREQWMTDVASAAYERQMCPVLWDTPGGEYNRRTGVFENPEFIEKLVNIAK